MVISESFAVFGWRSIVGHAVGSLPSQLFGRLSP
ncbi:hypothetical protein ABIA39_006602 [Nocardia sp. GAS34]